MALTLSSDIVAGVLMAAPAQPRDGSASRFAASAPTIASEPAAAPFRIGEPGVHGAEKASGIANLPPGAAGQPVTRDTAKIRAFVEFESLLVKTMLESILPGEDAQVFGSGFAGSMWRSMAAEQYASLFVSAGGLGLARGMEANFRGPGSSNFGPVQLLSSVSEYRG